MSFFSSVTAPTEIYTLSLHDALPIFSETLMHAVFDDPAAKPHGDMEDPEFVTEHLAEFAMENPEDRKSTRLNSSHRCISYAVFCLKKKNKQSRNTSPVKSNQQEHNRT